MTVINEIATIEFNGKRWLRWEGLLLVPLDFDPNSGVIVAVAPPGGIAGAGGVANLPALVKGDNGLSPVLQEDSELTEIEWNDPTPATSQWVLVTPGTDTVAPVYKEVKTVRKGPPGDPAPVNIVDAGDILGTLTPGKMLVVNDTADGYTLKTQKVGNVYWPATVTSASNVANATLCVVNIPPQDFDWRAMAFGGATVAIGGTGDAVVHLFARLNGETGGNACGRAYGPQRHTLESGSGVGATDSANLVAAGASATVHLRAERQLGSDNFSIDGGTVRFNVQVVPIP